MQDDEVKLLFTGVRDGSVVLIFIPIFLHVKVLKQVSNQRLVKDDLVLSEIFVIIDDEHVNLFDFLVNLMKVA